MSETSLLERPEAMEKANLSEDDRRDLLYKDSIGFGTPVIIRGTNRQLVPFQDMVSFENPSEKKLTALADACSGVDMSLTMTTIDNISELEIKSITDTTMVLYHEKTENHFFLDMPQLEESLPLKKFSTLLGIPYSFSKKNPAFLNRLNLEYWSKALTEAEGKQIPVDIVHIKEMATMENPEDDIENPLTKGYMIVNLLKAVTIARGRGNTEVVRSTLPERVPLWSNILRNVDAEVKKYDNECAAKLQSYSVGYKGSNKGRHFARLLLDSPESEITIGKDVFQLCLNLESDFSGQHKDFGKTNIDFGLFRQTCSNGMGVVWNEEQKEQIKGEYVANYLKAQGVTEGDEAYDKIVAEASSKFKLMFSKTGMQIPNGFANSLMEGSQMQQLIKIFFEAKDYIKGKIEELNVRFPEAMLESEFVETAHDAAQHLKVSPEVTKFFILEFIAGNMAKEQKFKTPMDCLNFLTYICRAYDTKIQMQVEKQAYTFATMLAAALVHQSNIKKKTYMSYLAQVKEELV